MVRQGKLGEGLLLLSKAVATYPNVPEIRYHFAVALMRAGNTAEAQSELTKALKPGAKFSGDADARALSEQLKARRK